LGLTRAEERELVRESLQRQAAQARVVAPFRLAGSLDDPQRQSDLRIAAIASREFRQARLGAAGRELWAGLRLDLETLGDPLARAGLVSLYAQLEVDGFVVELEGEDVELLAELVLGLELQSGKPVEAELDRNHAAVRAAQVRVLKRSASA
jgi:hypothetical protein